MTETGTPRCECGNACDYKFGIFKVVNSPTKSIRENEKDEVICLDCLEQEYGIVLEVKE